MSTALIIGISGQDGSYLAELLISKGYRVVGTVRFWAAINTPNLDNIRDSVDFFCWDMVDQAALKSALLAYRPSEVYNYAAYSSGVGMYDDPVAMADVNGVAVIRMLEAIRTVDTNIRFCQASSREVFGDAQESPQAECSVVRPRSPYGAAKAFADTMIQIYRRRYGLFACSAILYNHESPRRGSAYVTKKISTAAAQIKCGVACELQLGNLEARRDWGYAGDYVNAMRLMLQRPFADDYVIATGVSHSVRDFCQIAFDYLGLDYRDYLRVDSSAYRPPEPWELIGNAEKAHRELGWAPKVGFRELVEMMVDTDLNVVRREIDSPSLGG